MTRRRFITHGGLFVPLIFIPKLIRGQNAFAPAGQIVRNKVAAAGGATCDTLVESNTAASNGYTPFLTGTTSYGVGSFFTASESSDRCRLEVYMERLGSPTCTWAAGIWSSTGDPFPSALIEQGPAVNAADVPAAETLYSFDIDPAALTSATQYWVVCQLVSGSVVDLNNCLRLHRNAVGAGTNSVSIMNSSGVWSASSSTRRSKFATYKA